MIMSINRISFLHDFIEYDICIFNNVKVNIFNFADFLDVKNLLSELEEGKNYVVTFEFVYSFLTYNDEGPNIILTKPILINKNSNSQLISKFIQEKINEC